jgi:hypothetical protein
LRRRIKGGVTPGNVHVGKKTGGSPERLAKYLAKYLGKSLEEKGAGRKSYWHNKGAADAVKMNRWEPAAQTWSELEQELVGDDCIREVRWFNPSPGILWLEAWRLP